MWYNRHRKPEDGSNWSVLPDWEATRGICNNVMSITTPPPPLPYEIADWFKGDVFFEPIVHHLLGRDSGSSISEWRRAMHRSQGFMIERGKLWRLSSKPS